MDANNGPKMLIFSFNFRISNNLSFKIKSFKFVDKQKIGTSLIVVVQNVKAGTDFCSYEISWDLWTHYYNILNYKSSSVNGFSLIQKSIIRASIISLPEIMLWAYEWDSGHTAHDRVSNAVVAGEHMYLSRTSMNII